MNRDPAQPPLYRFTLYVVGDEANSATAKDNLQHICVEYLLEGTCTVTIVDVLKDYQIAIDNSVFVTPTLHVDGPRGRITILGNLSEIDRILMTLGCNK